MTYEREKIKTHGLIVVSVILVVICLLMLIIIDIHFHKMI